MRAGIFWAGLLVVAFVWLSESAAGASDWGSGKPSYSWQTISGFQTYRFCPEFISEVKVFGLGRLQEVCVFRVDSPGVGTYFSDGGEPRLAITHPFDEMFYPVEGVCKVPAGCVYSGEADTLVAREYGAGFSVSAVVYKGFSGRIRVGPSLGWSFDRSNQDFSVSGVEAIALSQNGRWLVAELKNRGILRVDLSTHEARRVVADGFQYGVGADPMEELAISNDGLTIAQMGVNAGLLVVRVTPGCGEAFRPIWEPRFPEGTVRCPFVPVDTTKFTPSFFFASHPVFDNEGGRLSFLVASYGQGSRRVTLRSANSVDVAQLDYLALGDSFSSGEGETDSSMYLPGFGDHCHVSRRAYSFLVAGLLSLPRVQNVACSGARIKDLIARQEVFVDTDTPGLITVGIGGNDAGLMTKLRTCAGPGVCEWATDSAAIARTGSELEALSGRLVNLYLRLRQDSPDSKIYAIGYPNIIQPDGLCDPVTALLFDRSERVFIREGIIYLNKVVRSSALKAGINYVGTWRSLAGNELCGGSLIPAINGLRLGDDVAAINSLPLLRFIGNETFHPTPYGQVLMAGTIAPQIQGIPCCESLDDQGLLGYWGVDSNRERRVAGDFLESETATPNDSLVRYAFPPGSFRPGSDVSIELHSEPIVLGGSVVADDGSLSGSVNIPPGTPEGLHAIHVRSTSNSLQAVDVYQLIEYGAAVTEPAAVVSVSTRDQSGAFQDTPIVDEIATLQMRNAENATEVLGVITDESIRPPINQRTAGKTSHGSTGLLPIVPILGAVGLLVVCWYLLRRKLRRHNSSTRGP